MDHRDHACTAGPLQRVERARAPHAEDPSSQHGKKNRGEEENREEDAEVDGREDTAGYTRVA
jgi:hypothetical protein